MRVRACVCIKEDKWSFASGAIAVETACARIKWLRRLELRSATGGIVLFFLGFFFGIFFQKT